MAEGSIICVRDTYKEETVMEKAKLLRLEEVRVVLVAKVNAGHTAAHQGVWGGQAVGN